MKILGHDTRPRASCECDHCKAADPVAHARAEVEGLREDLAKLTTELNGARAEASGLFIAANRERKRAEQYEADWRAAKSEFGDATAKLRAKIRDLEADREFACENTPTKGCDCPGCCNARRAAE